MLAFASSARADPQIGTAASGLPSSDAIRDQGLLPSPATGQRGVQIRTNLLPGKSLQAGPTIDYRPSTANLQVPAVAAHQDDPKPVELGGFVGYLFYDEMTGQPTSSFGFDLQFASDSDASTGGWLVQPGLDYAMPLTSSWQFNTRLFSTYGPKGYGSTLLTIDRPAALHFGGDSDIGFQDVGVGLGLGYSITDSWNIQTQARYQRMLGSGEAENQGDTSAHRFFGGVMLDYKF